MILRALLVTLCLCSSLVSASIDASAADAGGDSIPTIAAGTAQPGSTTGFWVSWSPIAEPAQQGSAGLGFNDNAVAVWDVVQYSMQSGTFNVCVAGAHPSSTLANPLAGVTFYLDNGTGVTVSAPNHANFSLNEYCVKTTDTALNDGQHEFRAVACPARGYCRVLQSVSTATVTSGVADVQVPAHGQEDTKTIWITSVNVSSGSNNFIVSSPASRTPYYITRSGISPNSFQLSSAAGCCGSAITPAFTGTMTVYYANAGNIETQPSQGESLFINTNGNGHVLPSTRTVAFVDSVNGSNANDCLESTHTTGATGACADTHAALTAMRFLNSDGQSFRWSNGSARFTLSGADWTAGQAVVFRNTPPAPFMPGRPYWVVSSLAGGFVELALTPAGSPVAVTQAGSGHVTLDGDYSNFTLYLECSASATVPTGCGSPSSYYLKNGNTGFTENTSYGYLNVSPYQTSGHNTIASDGDAGAQGVGGTGSIWCAGSAFDGGLRVQKVHFQVDAVDNPTRCANRWFIGYIDTWYDNLTYTGFPEQKYANGMGLTNGSGSGAGGYGYVAATNVNYSAVNFGFRLIQMLEGTTTFSTFDCGIAQLQLGNTCHDVNADAIFLNRLQGAQNANKLVLNFGTNPFTSTGFTSFPSSLYSAVWVVENANGNPASRCVDNGPFVQSISVTDPFQINLASPSRSICNGGDAIPIGLSQHVSMFANLGNAVANTLVAYTTCVTNCLGKGFYNQTNSTPPARNFDQAYVGTQIAGANDGILWAGQQPLAIEDTGSINFTYLNDAWSSGGLGAGMTGPGTANEFYFLNNSCTNTFLASGWTGATVVGGSCNRSALRKSSPKRRINGAR